MAGQSDGKVALIRATVAWALRSVMPRLAAPVSYFRFLKGIASFRFQL